MSTDSNQKSNIIKILDVIVGIAVLVGLFFLFKYIWHGITWAFSEYVELLKVK